MKLTLTKLTEQFSSMIATVTDKRGTKAGLVITLKPGFTAEQVTGKKVDEVFEKLAAVQPLAVATPVILASRTRRADGLTKSIIDRASTFMRAAQNAYPSWGQY